MVSDINRLLYVNYTSISSVQSFSHVWLFATHGLQHARLPCPSSTPELAQTHAHQVSDAIQPSHPLSCPSPPAFNLSQHQGLFKWVSSSHQVAKYWSFSFSISHSNEYSGLIFFRINWFDLLLSVQGTLTSLLQRHSSKASIFGVQFSLWSNSHIHTWLLEKP